MSSTGFTAIAARLVVSAFCMAMPLCAHADGATIYDENCAACHGESGEGNADLRAPVIAGLDAAYVARQAAHFLSGIRPVPADNDMAIAMIDLMRELSEADIGRAAGHIASLPAPAVENEKAGVTFRARGLYSGCSSCHGSDASGNASLGAPRLSDQFSWYLKAQLDAFRAGTRGADPADKFGHQMKAMADAVASDEDVDTLVNYIASLGQ